MGNYYDSEFVNEIIFPASIIHKHGNVCNENAVTEEKPLQITTSEVSCLTLKNSLLSGNSYILLDFGKELNGKLRMLTHTLDGCNMAKIRITYGESVAEALSKPGTDGATNDHATRDFVISVPAYSDMSFIESGFRYCKIELLNANAAIRIKSIVAVAIYRRLEYKGSFRCDNELLNKIFDTAAYTCHLSMQQYIWDGIKRDRLVWVGDMHPEMLTVKTVFGPHKIIEESLDFMRCSNPLPDWMNGMPTYSLWWIIILYDWYFYTGNTDFLNRNKEYAIGLINQISDLVRNDGSDLLPSYFLDWPCNNRPEAVTGSRALLIMCLNKAESLCRLLNENALAEKCADKAERIRKTDCVTYGAKQVMAMSALSAWADKKEMAEEILRDGCKGWSTFMSYYLLTAAAEKDMVETLDALSEYYGAMLKFGATTFWEDFDIEWTKNSTAIDELPVAGKTNIHADFGKFCYSGLRHSLCHGWSSAPTAFLAEKVLGISVASAGCRDIIISPDLGNLKFAYGTYPTPFGTVSIRCERKDDKITVRYSAPAEINISLKNAEFGGNL